MLTRRAALSGAAVAAVAVHTPASAATEETVRCCQATVFVPEFGNHLGLLFDLPQGMFLVDHAALYHGKYMSSKSGAARFITSGEVHRSFELRVPRTFLDAALALHAANESLRQCEESIWENILNAQGITFRPA